MEMIGDSDSQIARQNRESRAAISKYGTGKNVVKLLLFRGGDFTLEYMALNKVANDYREPDAAQPHYAALHARYPRYRSYLQAVL